MILLLCWVLLTAVGCLIGAMKNRAGLGALLGFLFGPIGWLVVAVLPINHPLRCPACLSGVPYGASKCAHCASALPAMTHQQQVAEAAARLIPAPPVPQLPPRPVDPARPYGHLTING